MTHKQLEKHKNFVHTGGLGAGFKIYFGVDNLDHTDDGGNKTIFTYDQVITFDLRGGVKIENGVRYYQDGSPRNEYGAYWNNQHNMQKQYFVLPTWLKKFPDKKALLFYILFGDD